MLKPHDTPRIQRHITEKELDGVLYLLDPQKGHLHTLNETAKVIWTQLKQNKSISQIIEAVVEQFNVRPGEAKKDVLQFLKRMTRLETLAVSPQKSGKKSNKQPSSSQQSERKHQR